MIIKTEATLSRFSYAEDQEVSTTIITCAELIKRPYL